MSTWAESPGRSFEPGPLRLPRLRFAKPSKRTVETIVPREILRWSLEWPAIAEGDRPCYEPVIGAWRVRVS